MTTPLFEVRGVSFSYDGIAALSGIDVTLDRGTRYALLGANGSGKSTFLRLLDALDLPSEGTIAFDGTALNGEHLDRDEFAFAFRRRVGLLFQNPDAQLFNPTVRDELAFAPLQLGWSRDETRAKIASLAAEMNLEHLLDRPPHRLSMGEKKRVAIASIVIAGPEVLLLDEPTAALDPASQSHVINMLSEWSGGDRTTVTATHDLGIVEDIADVCIVFDNGRIASVAAPSQVLADVPLLQRCGLLHAHRHSHAGGVVHTHPHLHTHGDHEHR